MNFLSKRPGAATILGLCAVLAAGTVQAELQDQGDGTVLDTATSLIWLKDGNLFYTQYQANPAIIDEIVAGAPALDDVSTGGPHVWNKDGTLTDIYTDFVDPNATNTSPAVNGAMTWFGAMAWVNWLNAHNYLGHNDWRLPSVKPLNGTSFDYSGANSKCNGTSDRDPWITSPFNELSNLFYSALGNQAGRQKGDCEKFTSEDPNAYGLLNAGTFQNFKKTQYWTATDYTDPNNAPGSAWTFDMTSGEPAIGEKVSAQFYALPVRGTASGATPLPSTSPTPTPAPTGGYVLLDTVSCTQLDAKGRRFRFDIMVANQGAKKKPAGKLALSATRGSKSFKIASRKVLLKPGAQKALKVTLRAKGTGDVVFKASLGSTEVSATCSAAN